MRRVCFTVSMALAAATGIGVLSGQDGASTSDSEALAAQVERLLDEAHQLRMEVARVRLENSELKRELEEMGAFVRDYAVFGDSFESYQSVKRIAERDAARRAAEEMRDARQREREERRRRQEEMRRVREVRDAQANRVESFRKRGFSPLGLEVYTSQMAFHYRAHDDTPIEVDYEPVFGRFLRLRRPFRTIDFSRMTISGSIVNGNDITRNVGVAVTFFDENGSQVGHEIIQIENARPDVPYPFTSTVSMALDRPFASSSTYVLYADPVGE